MAGYNGRGRRSGQVENTFGSSQPGVGHRRAASDAQDLDHVLAVVDGVGSLLNWQPHQPPQVVRLPDQQPLPRVPG
jgi:hypothetical protein